MSILNNITKILVSFSILAGVIGCGSSSGTDDPKPSGDEIVTVPDGYANFKLDSNNLQPGGEGSMYASGAEMTDVLTIKNSSSTFTAEVTKVAVKYFKFRVPEELVAGAYDFIISRQGKKDQTLLKGVNISIKSIDFNVPDKEGMNLKGIVYCGNKGVANVLVTDGVEFTKTNEKGQYWLNSSKVYSLVYLTMPSGYFSKVQGAIPQFFARTSTDTKVTEQHNFELFSEPNDNHTMLMVTDIHLANRATLYPKDYTQFSTGWVAEAIREYSGKKNVYCMNMGDFAWDHYWYSDTGGETALQSVVGQISSLPFAFWSTMGNHDNNGHAGCKEKGVYSYNTPEFWAKDLEASVPFRKYVGPDHSSMNIGKIHYMQIDDINYRNDYTSGGGDDDPENPSTTKDPDMGDRNYNAGFRPDVMEWMRKDLSYVDKSTPIVIGMHIPILNATGSQYNTEFNDYEKWKEFLDLFKDFNEVDFITGHTHCNRFRPVPGYGTNFYEHNIAAICGIWWNTSRGAGAEGSAANATPGKINMNSDGCPTGYMVMESNGTSRKWHWKVYGVNKTVVSHDKQFKSYDMNEVQKFFQSYGPAKDFIAAGTSAAGIENSSSQSSTPIRFTENSYDASSSEPNTVWINVWGFEKGSYASYGNWTVKVTENGKTTDITSVSNDTAGTKNPIEGYHDPLSAVTYDVFRYGLNRKLSSSSISRSAANRIFKYVATSPNSTLTIRVTDRFGNVYQEQMQRPKKFWDGTTPYYTLD